MADRTDNRRGPSGPLPTRKAARAIAEGGDLAGIRCTLEPLASGLALLDSEQECGRRRADAKAAASVDGNGGGRKGPLPSDDLIERVRRWQEHQDRLARDELVMDHQPLVSAIARSYWRYWADPEDLQQEGNLGLLEAIDRFDCTRGTRFGAYARPWVRAAMLRFLVDNVRLVRVGRTRGERRIFFGLSEAERTLCARGVDPTPAALGALLRVDPAEVEFTAWRLAQRDLSIDASLEEPPHALTTNGVESRVAHSELCAAVRDLANGFLSSLEPRDAEIVRERLLESEPPTLQELGDRFGVSRERVRQIEECALDRLRRHVRNSLPDPELWADSPSVQSPEKPVGTSSVSPRRSL